MHAAESEEAVRRDTAAAAARADAESAAEEGNSKAIALSL
jgi:hypothetical protein